MTFGKNVLNYRFCIEKEIGLYFLPLLSGLHIWLKLECVIVVKLALLCAQIYIIVTVNIDNNYIIYIPIFYLFV